jgi:hypothetical protein
MTLRFLSLAAFVLFASPLLAAPVPPPAKTDDAVSATAVKLLQQRRVQKELKMTAEQRIAIVDGLEDLQEAFEKKLNDISRMPNVPDDAFDKIDQEHQKNIQKLFNETATKSLNATQRTRLQQLDWHIRGVAAFADAKVAKMLQLDEKQQKLATDLRDQQQGAVNNYLDGIGADDDQKRRADLFEQRKKLLKTMEDKLTADQKTAWQTMIGETPKGFQIDEIWLRVEEELDLIKPELRAR